MPTRLHEPPPRAARAPALLPEHFRATEPTLADAEDAHAELHARFCDLRAMKPATAALLFGSEAAWKQALARVGVAAGRQLGTVEALRRRLRASPAFTLESIARPLAPNSRVQWTGD